jgi:hypothetical protein
MALQDAVNHPAHYNMGNIEAIDAIEEWQLGFNAGNAVKYIARHQHKGTPVQDLKKALWYIARELMVAHKVKSIDLMQMVLEVKKDDIRKDIDDVMRAHPELFGDENVPSAPFLKGTPLAPLPPVFGTPGSPVPPYIATSDAEAK